MNKAPGIGIDLGTRKSEMLAPHDVSPMTASLNTFEPTCQKALGVRAVSPVEVGGVEAGPRPGYRLKDHGSRYDEVVIVNQVKEEK